jgi:hypothetical protein
MPTQRRPQPAARGGPRSGEGHGPPEPTAAEAEPRSSEPRQADTEARRSLPAEPSQADESDERSPADPTAGRGLVLVDAIGTAVFVVTAVVEAILLERWTELLGVTVALVLFAAGCVAFLLAYARAIQRSRHDEIAVASLFLLAGPAVPGPVKAKLGGLLATQVVVALATAIIRSFSPLAFGVLVPVFGVGLNGLWAARYGAFPPRRARPMRSDHRRGGEMGQNADHG